MAELKYDETGRLLFTEEMREEYTILMPQMAPYHFGYVSDVFNAEGYRSELLRETDADLIHEGMKHSHNDLCLPATLVIGQLINAVKKRKYDVNKVALIIVQTGGSCRASNYIKLLRKGLKAAELDFVPVISLNAGGLEKNPGFKITPRFLHKLHEAIIFGDLMMTLVNQHRPYEKTPGATMALKTQIDREFADYFAHRRLFTWRKSRKKIAGIIRRFKNLETVPVKKPKVGIVGEVYVKFSPLGNNNLETVLESEDVEVVMPPLYDFLLYCLDSRAHDIRRYGGPFKERAVLKGLIGYIELHRKQIRKTFKKEGLDVPLAYKDLRKLVTGYIDVGTHIGEGWMLTAEIVELIKQGVPNIVCTQPFGCLPNHIVGKGMFKKIKKHFPESNLVAIDYDTSATEVNQMNRINLMIQNARAQLEKKS